MSKKNPSTTPIEQYKVYISSKRQNLNLMRIKTQLEALPHPLQLYRHKTLEPPPPTLLPPMPQKSRARIVDEAEAADDVFNEEKNPWVLEDAEQHAFVGNYDHEVTTDAVFLFDNGEFQLVPLARVYRFASKFNAPFLHAQAGMPEGRELFVKTGDARPATADFNSTLLKKIGALSAAAAASGQQGRLRDSSSSRRKKDEHGEEIDYEDIVDDDEEDTGDFDDDDVRQQSRKLRALSHQGKMTKKLLEKFESEESANESSSIVADDVAAEPKPKSAHADVQTAAHKRQKVSDGENERNPLLKELYDLLVCRKKCSVKYLFIYFKDRIKTLKGKEQLKKALEQIGEKRVENGEVVFYLRNGVGESVLSQLGE